MKVQEILGKSPLIEKEQSTPTFCLPRCYIGLEYEWEDIGKLPLPPYAGSGPIVDLLNKFYDIYSKHNDGSLRGNSGEFVFKEPRSGTRVESGLDIMDEISRMFGFTGSYRTSLHVHMDMQGMNFPEEVVLVCALYCVCEPFFYKFIGNQREMCNYCVPWYAHPQHFTQFFKGLRDDIITNLKRGTDTAERLKGLKSYKYAGLNLFSLGDFGTIEFRHAPVDMQKAKIITWINALMRLKKYVIDNRGLTADRLLLTIEKAGPTAFLSEVLQSEFREITKYSRSIHEDFHKGMKTMYHFLLESQLN